jgi:hypothetical protein
MIINNNFDTLKSTEQIKNPLIPFFVEENDKAIRVGILPGTVLFLATNKSFSPLKDVVYFNCVKDDGIYLNLKVSMKKTAMISTINWKDPDININCVLEPEKDKFIKDNEEQVKYAEKQIELLNQEIKDLEDQRDEALSDIDPDIVRPGFIEEAKQYYAEKIEDLRCRPNATTTTTTTAEPTETTTTTTTTTTTLEPSINQKCIDQHKKEYKPVEPPEPLGIVLVSICAWQKQIKRLEILKQKIMEVYNQNVAYEKEDSVRYGKHNKLSIGDISISMSKENNLEVKEGGLIKESHSEMEYKFLLAKVEEINKTLVFTSKKFEFPQLIIKYGLFNTSTETFKNSATVNCVYPDVKEYTSMGFFLTSI